MEEDRQPNERRLQRKGDHRVPSVRSSAAQKRIQTKKSWRRKTTPRVYSADCVGALDDAFGEQGSSGGRRLSPSPLRDLGPARDELVADRPPAMTSVSIRDAC